MLQRALILALAGLGTAAAVPEPTSGPALSKRALILNETQLNSSLSVASKSSSTAYVAALTSLYSAVQPSAAPTNVAVAFSSLASAYKARPSDPYAAGASLLLSGLAGQSSFGQYTSDIDAFGPCNGYNQQNPPPPTTIYPKKGANDAPYDVDEASLRAAIYIPSSFTYGRVKPAIFIPGTGGEACEGFSTNIGKLFTGSNYADPVYVNIPLNTLIDIQVAAEYVAYAINYIQSVTGANASVISWSQGSISSHWSFKYWPSTRQSVDDMIALSGDYHGTVLAPLLCPPGDPCAPAVLQQYYNSKFIAKVRQNGGDSAYVPTTTVHSIFDEIVEPQQDPYASGTLNNKNGVNVTNVQIQSVCPPGTPAGGPNFGHENTIYNAVTFALVMDAIKNPGPANVQRSGASAQCGKFFADGLTLGDVFATEALIPLAGYNILTAPNKVVTEPPIKSYATY